MGWFFKLSNEGDIIWAETYDRNSAHMDILYNCNLTQNGNIIFVGSAFSSGTPNQQGWLLVTDQNGCYFNCSLSLEDSFKSSCRFYPNPNEGECYINSFSSHNAFLVYDIYGRYIHGSFERVNEQTIKFTLKDEKNGMYYILDSSTGQVFEVIIHK